MISLQNQAINTALAGDWEKAVLLNKNLLKENPKDIDTLNRLAFAFNILGKNKEAKLTYQKVLKIDTLNPIALRNIKRILSSPSATTENNGQPYKVCNIFIEEPGKTKIVELINAAQPEIINGLQTGQILSLSVKRLKIFVSSGQHYVGMLPDDIAKRLIKFIESGNTYEAYMKSATGRAPIIFIKETKRVPKYKDQPSFISGNDAAFTFDKTSKKVKTNSTPDKPKSDEEDEDDSNYSPDEEA